MKNQLQNDSWRYRLVVALSGQSTAEVLIALGSAAVTGSASLLVPFPLNR